MVTAGSRERFASLIRKTMIYLPQFPFLEVLGLIITFFNAQYFIADLVFYFSLCLFVYGLIKLLKTKRHFLAIGYLLFTILVAFFMSKEVFHRAIPSDIFLMPSSSPYTSALQQNPPT